MLIKDGITDLIFKREKTTLREETVFSKLLIFFCHTSGIKISFWLQIYTFFFQGGISLQYSGLSVPPIFQFENQFWNSKWCIFKIMLKFPHKCCVASMVCQAENLIDVCKVPSIVFFDSFKTCLIALLISNTLRMLLKCIQHPIVWRDKWFARMIWDMQMKLT